MTRSITLRAILALIIFVMGNLQAWDSNAPAAGLLIVFLVSLAISLPAVALLIPIKPTAYLGAFALSLTAGDGEEFFLNDFSYLTN